MRYPVFNKDDLRLVGSLQSSSFRDDSLRDSAVVKLAIHGRGQQLARVEPDSVSELKFAVFTAMSLHTRNSVGVLVATWLLLTDTHVVDLERVVGFSREIA